MAKTKIALSPELAEGIKKLADLNKRSLTKEIEHVMTQYLTANLSKVSQQKSLTKSADQALEKSSNQ